MNIDIVSFARLACRIFGGAGGGDSSPCWMTWEKSMVLRKVAAAQKRQLVLFGGQLSRPGSVGQLRCPCFPSFTSTASRRRHLRG
ncbi:MAG: hypothetical protein ACLUD2_05220 [Clostridium sp.]